MRVFTFDTTLRDGTQGENVSFSADDKVMIAHKLDELGIDYIEGGWPGSNPKDKEFFLRARDMKLKHARLVAFGATRFNRNPVEEDASVNALIESGTPVVSIFGKSWDLHVHRALGITEEENLVLIADTVKYLKDHGKEVVYDAEHFFDGYTANKDFALRTLEAAKKRRCRRAGPVRDQWRSHHQPRIPNLCRGSQAFRRRARHPHPQRLRHGRRQLAGRHRTRFRARPRLHEWLRRALRQRQPHFHHCQSRIKDGPQHHRPRKAGSSLTSVARFIAELANLPLRSDQPFVGNSAFAHKGGVHVAAVLKDAATYEHINPKVIGNRQRVLLSDLSGKGSILYKLKQHGLEDRLDDSARRELLDRIKQMEFQGYELEAAEGTFELLVREALRPGMQLFEVVSYETTTRGTGTTATVTLKAQDGIHSATANGNGPVNALDLALRQCLATLYPSIADVKLTDYKVRVLDFKKGTAARVRVLVEWSDHRRSWSTVGVSENVIEASWFALVDALRLELMRINESDPTIDRAVEDYCWGV